MKLSLRISLIIGIISIAISSLVAYLSYYHQLEQLSSKSQALVYQIASSANRTSAIAAYLNDIELAEEIVQGTVNNDLVAGAYISILSTQVQVGSGSIIDSSSDIKINLNNPFDESDTVGHLVVKPNDAFIQAQASQSSLNIAYLLLSLSVISALLVGLFVRFTLTKPMNRLSTMFERVDTRTPEAMQSIDIGYKRKDEIYKLVGKVNQLIFTLKQQFASEKQLRKSTEELQKKFRLLFEQATAGICLLTTEGKISIANPAFNQLFNKMCEGHSFVDLFDDPSLVEAQITLLSLDNGYSQVDLDLISFVDGNKTHLHCLFSAINDTRSHETDALEARQEQLIEVIIYDVTARREKESKARYEADHDSLTKLLNRRSGTAHLQAELDRVHKAEQCFALMMIDLDKFKPINDTYGHDVGDIVLKDISTKLLKLTREVDAHCIRWGGDEFLIGISLCNQKAIESFAEIILSKIGEEIKVDNDLSVSVGASIGIVTLSTTKTHTVKLEALIASADDLMYDTKKHNRNHYKIVPFLENKR